MGQVGELQAQTQAALEAAIAARALPKEARQTADALLKRMQTVTRVTLLGRPGSGKSEVLNLLAGARIVPPALTLCTLHLVYGEAERTTVTLRDGSNLTMDGALDLGRVAAMQPVFLKVEAPLPALAKISILEVVTSVDRMEQIRAVNWASKQTDIAIWCTEDYDPTEQALWDNMPDAIKDHAILLRTRMDLMGTDRDARLRELTRDAGVDFAHVLPISATEAQAAKPDGGAVDKPRLKASGAMTLISTILRKIEQGRQHAVDQAAILLHTHKDNPTADDFTMLVPDTSEVRAVEHKIRVAQPQPAPEPTPEPQDTKAETASDTPPVMAEAEPVFVEPAPELQEYEPPQPEAAVTPEVAIASEPEVQPAAAPSVVPAIDGSDIDEDVFDPDFDELVKAEDAAEPAETQEPVAAEAEQQAGPDDASIAAWKKVLSTAANRLQSSGAKLLEHEDPSAQDILSVAARDISWLAGHLAEVEIANLPGHGALMQMTEEAEDLVQLLKIEGGEDSAVDAVTTLLQLRRGCEAQLAA